MSEGFDVSSDGGVLTLRLDRPDRRNAIDPASARWLTGFLVDADTDASIRCVLLTGTGRDYCTGADLAGTGDATERITTMDYRFASDGFRDLFQALWEVEKPVVAAVNGTVAGAGWMFALLADLVVADADARWTHVFARRGMAPHAGDPYFLPRIIPFHRLNELALLSDTVTSTTLEGWGLINRCVPAAEVLPVARELAGRLAEGPTRTLGITKRLYRRSLGADMSTAFEDERNATALLATTNDRKEGVDALLEGRPPRFTGT